MRFTKTDAIFAMLAVATGVSWWLGESAVAGSQHLGSAATLAVLALSAAKGALIALDYMELRHAPALWRRAVMGWLVVVLAGIATIAVIPF
ncbi:MAG: cytochrome C oxidase subunit IV family protein [Burkholderiaceae bacterium]